ncbi:MAG TPA: glycosyltransferase [Ktedonobacteraceae bacterium]|nr:glycosyltransferase [Ktedonobacteraceae bacterium]
MAKASSAKSHEVLFACPRSLFERIRTSGFNAVVTLDDTDPRPDPEKLEMRERVFQLPAGAPMNAVMVSDGFIGIHARRALPEVMALCRRWQPDIIVREEFELSGAVAAEALNIPHAAMQITYYSSFADLAKLYPNLITQLNALRASGGLPPDPDLEMLSRYLVLSCEPPSYLDPAARLVTTLHCLQLPVFDNSAVGATTLAEWLNEPYMRPLIYVTLGSEAPDLPGMFPAIFDVILDGLRNQDGTVVVTIGEHNDPAALKPQPPNVHVENYVPQSLLLPHCDAVVTHGGHNTVLGALSFGLPLVVIPFYADQPDNAARCTAIGVGRAISPSELSPEKVRDAVSAVLGDERYKRHALQIQAEMHALPDVHFGVQLLERLATERRPIVSG